MNHVRKLFPRFSSHKLESEYIFNRNRQLFHDFQATVILMVAVNIVLAVPAIIEGDATDMSISLGFIGFLIAMLIIKRFLSGYIQYLSFFLILAYYISRFFVLQHNFTSFRKISMFFTGYGLGSMQTILVTRIPRIEFKICAILVAYGLRFGFMYGVVTPDGVPSVNVLTFLRQLVIDIFIIYIFYSSEKTERKIFQSYYESREELLKFKELLADTLPLSIMIMDSRSSKLLFSNKSFLSTFDPSTPIEADSPRMTMTTTEANLNSNKPQMETLMVDQATVRELGTLNPTMNISHNSTVSTYLRDVIQDLIQDNLLTEKPITLTAFHYHQDQKRSFEVILKNIKWDRNDATAIVMNEITYQENMTALKMSNMNKDKVIATVSHELRTPLNGILGILNIIEKKVNSDEIEEYISLCKDNANLLLSLVNSILDLQQVATGKLKLNPSKMDIRKVLNGIIKLFQFQCSQKGIYIRLSIHSDVTDYITSDENRFKQILINLVGNAIKFTSKGGIKIEVIVSPENQNSLLISVVDTGIGIREEDRQKLFKMYGRLEDGSSMNKNGVGLGLTISNVLAVVLNGRTDNNRGIDVESEYGVGSRFYFEIQKNLLKHDLELKNFGIQDHKREFNKSTSNFKNGSFSRPGFNHMTERDFIKDSEEENLDSDYQEELVMPVELELKLASYISLKKFTTEELNSYSRIYKLSMNRDMNSYEGRANTIIQHDRDDRDQLDFNESQVRSTIRLAPPEDSQNPQTSDRIYPEKDIAQKDCILVVDDNPFNLLVADNLIKESGYTTKIALGGQEAIDILKAASKKDERIKAVVLDCHMPLMDGYQTAKTLRNMMEKKEIQKAPILGWTANNSEDEIRRCFDSGMTDYLPKPASQTAFLKAFSKLE